jgi:FkbM family methyltransferase
MRRVQEAVPRQVRIAAKIARARAYERAGSDRFSWPALWSIDRKLQAHLPRRPGFFLEIGGNDGYSQSNTYALERLHGWHGILVEPLPSLCRWARLARRRSFVFNCACVGPGGPDSIEMLDLNLMSVARGMQDADDEQSRLHRGRAVQVPARPLSDVIEEAGGPRVDFMSVDVEGAELQVLAGLDLDRHAPGHLLVETRYPERVEELVGSHLKLVDAITHHDYLFERHSG